MNITLPYPISANRYWSNYVLPGSKRAMQGPSSEAKRYKRAVAQIAMAQGMRMLAAPYLELTMTLHPPSPQDAAKRARTQGPWWHLGVRCLDIDNCVKVTLDALQGVAYENDKQVVALLVQRGLPVEGGALQVEVKRIELAHAFPQVEQPSLLPDPCPFSAAA